MSLAKFVDAPNLSCFLQSLQCIGGNPVSFTRDPSRHPVWSSAVVSDNLFLVFRPKNVSHSTVISDLINIIVSLGKTLFIVLSRLRIHLCPVCVCMCAYT